MKKNRELINKEALLSKALEPEFSVDDRCDTLMEIAQDYLRDKLFYLGCVKIYEEAGDNKLVEEYKEHAKRVDETYLEPLGKILGEIKLPTWNMEREAIEEVRKYFGDEYLEDEED